jgi:beta-lactamase class A
VRSRTPGFYSFLRWFSLGMVFAGVLLTVIQLVTYSRIRNNFPSGMTIAEVPVGSLDQKQAAERLSQAYGIPIELRYREAIIQVKPALVGFDLDMAAMLAAADMQRVNQPFWSAFWEYLWGRLPPSGEVPLIANILEERLRAYLEDEIASRYDEPPTPAMPVAGSVNFTPGEPGTTLDVNHAVILVKDALRSPKTRTVSLTFNTSKPIRPSLDNLQVLLKQIINLAGYNGLTEIYLTDLQTGQELQFAYQDGEDLPPDISFTAASTVKIPIMISIFRRVNDPAPEKVTKQIELMIERSENGPADSLMEEILDPTLGPLIVTEDISVLGLENTFLAGHFYPGAPLLRRFETPANSRTDVFTDPDVYNQTTTSDIGQLLEDIYQCSETGGSALSAVFPGEISQEECRLMIQYLSLNRIGVLIEAGVPDGTRVAHKHGWITEMDGVIHTIGDTGIIFTPGGNYVLTIFLYHPVQLVCDIANPLMAQLSAAIYNYFNLVQ